MPLTSAPPLPPFIAVQLPYERRGYELERGAVAGRRLSYLVSGAEDGRPVVLLHGNPTWSFLWRQVVAELADDGLWVIAPDLLGLGFSDRLRRIADHSLAVHADAVAELLTALDVQGGVIVGQDWGGPILAATGARVGERLAGVVLANTAVVVPRRPRGTWFHRFARLPIVSDLVFRGLGFPQNVMHRIQGDPASIRGEVARAYRWPLRHWRDRVAPLALARMVPDGPEHPSMPELRRGEAWLRERRGPTALVWGERDPLLGRQLKRHVETFPDATVRRTEAGHFLQEEVPATVAAAIREVAAKI